MERAGKTIRGNNHICEIFIGDIGGYTMAYRAQLNPHEGGLLYNSVEGIVEVPKWRHRMDSKALYLADMMGVVFDQHYRDRSIFAERPMG